MNEELLINLVQGYKELYDLQDPHYDDQQRRDNIWKEIGGIMKEPGVRLVQTSEPVLPPHHVETLDNILYKYVNYSSFQQGSLIDYLLGKPIKTTDGQVTNLDLTFLNYNTFKNILEDTKNKHNNESYCKSRRSILREGVTEINIFSHSHEDAEMIPIKAINMMRQSIYTTRERLRDTLFYRRKYAKDNLYNIGLVVGNVHQLSIKSDNLFAQMKKLREKFPGSDAHFLWYLIIYEKLLAINTDITDLVKRAFMYQDQWKLSVHGDSPEETFSGYKLSTAHPTYKPFVPLWMGDPEEPPPRQEVPDTPAERK